MPDSFVCSLCGKEHAGLLTDVAYTLPDVVWAIPEAERSERARFSNDLCQFGDRYFIRCLLQVPFTEAEGYFGWGVWAEIDLPVFKRYWDLYEADAADEPPYSGTLANEIDAYDDTLGRPVQIQFRTAKDRPSLHVMPDDESRLAFEQRNGIDAARHHEILETR